VRVASTVRDKAQFGAASLDGNSVGGRKGVVRHAFNNLVHAAEVSDADGTGSAAGYNATMAGEHWFAPAIGFRSHRDQTFNSKRRVRSSGGCLDPRIEHPGRPARATAEDKSGLGEGRGTGEIVVPDECLSALQRRMRSDAAQPLQGRARDAKLLTNRVDV